MDAYAHLQQVVGKFFGHALGEGGDEAPFAALDPGLYLLHEVVYLPAGGLDGDDGVQQARGSDYLLHHLVAHFHFVRAGGGGDEDNLVHVILEFPEVEGTVVHGRGQAEAELHQRILAGGVAVIHAPDLGKGHVGLVDEHEEVFGEVVHEGPGGAARGATADVTGVVFNAGAVANLGHHFHVVAGAGLQPGGFQNLALAAQVGQPFGQLFLDVFDGQAHLFFGSDEVLGGVDLHLLAFGKDFAGEGVYLDDTLYFVAPKLDANGHLFVGGQHLQSVPTDAESAPNEADVVAFVLHRHQVTHKAGAGAGFADAKGRDEGVVFLRVSQAVDA